MKTTVVIADALLEEAKEHARNEGTTLRALIEEGLRVILAKPGSGKSGYTLPDFSFQGNGLQQHLEGADWETIKTFAREERL
ncbi:type II toxin-antitoxin system VapB family antitoxin [Glycomyces sp. L485]|uniref:type II toxin-antitoxin system VapB family antitoxin n=1 Tax=Glycomyces sp. L485 TaxID=2909235 RepID=UPI001F4A9C2A|nr:type II toxin-antitoxin system VapB family antitoxin [Glycomyces sp. L485]MCH7232211.1 type II toxin-antitoxin system VapB family antitoxin [Glycomyces sp. L485]